MNSGIIGTVLLLLVGFSANAQEENHSASTELMPAGMGELKIERTAPVKSKIDEHKIYRVVSKRPVPPTNLSRFLAENLKYPKQAFKNKIQGTVMVEFVVERDGSLSDIKVVRGAELGHGLPEEAIRLIRSTPKWTPATSSEKAVRAYFVMPVSFNLQ